MLHKETVENETFGILADLMQDDFLQDFFLVGGTNLSLRLGHRKSADIDLFTQKDFNPALLRDKLRQKYNFTSTYASENTLKGFIDNVAIDCIAHKYPLAEPLENLDGIRMASIEDVAAMKLNAIIGNGTRLKDFVDIAELSKFMPLDTMIDAYEKKYGEDNSIIISKALTYHDDIDFENEPIRLAGKQFSFDAIKKRLEEMALNPGKLFEK